ncbi:MAG: tetratricopeptide repeat protein [Nitrososphaerota archaeon]|nr:tetratricopeptide repeat protein [Nitrososphaerota archaeon]
MPKRERRLAAIMFTDMVGYTALGQRNEALSLELVEEQKRLIRLAVRADNGRDVKTIGDAFLIEFPSALNAVRCAYAIQKAVREYNISSSEERRFQIRIGIHLGDVVDTDGDISGDAVNVASRIESLAEPGGVCLTRQVFDHVQNKFELSLVSVGEKQLKNVASQIELYRMKMPWEKEDMESPNKSDTKRIAVLPFANMSPDPNDEYFADGMTEELISAMSKVIGLEVTSRTSVMQYKKNPRMVKDVSRELGVGSVLEGSVRKTGDRLRITVQLIDSRKDLHLWSETYDRKLEDVFATQSEIAERVAGALKVKLLAQEMTRIQEEPTKNIEAYTNCIKGVQTIRKGWSEEDTWKAIGFFERAIELDPEYATPHAWLATCYLTPYVTATVGSILPASQAVPVAERAIKRSIELDPSLAEAHLASGQLCKLRLNWKEAEKEIRRAIELDPSVSGGQSTYAWTLLSMGRHQEALAAATKALKLDPLSPDTHEALGFAYYCMRAYDDAIKCIQRMEEWGANPMLVSSRLGWLYLEKGWYDKALKEWEKVGLEADLAVLYAKMGRTDEARKILMQAKKEGYQGWGLIEIHLALGDTDEAIQLLERAYELQDAFTFSLMFSHLWDGVRSDPRVVALEKKTGLV